MTYGEHNKTVAKAQAAYEAVSSLLCKTAIAAGHGNIVGSELRKMPEYVGLYTQLAVCENKLCFAERAAVEDHCAYYENGRFHWYSQKDANRFRRNAAKRVA